jgi:hypothetical protein
VGGVFEKSSKIQGGVGWHISLYTSSPPSPSLGAFFGVPPCNFENSIFKTPFVLMTVCTFEDFT